MHGNYYLKAMVTFFCKKPLQKVGLGQNTVVLGEQKVKNMHQVQIIHVMKEQIVPNMKMMLLKSSENLCRFFNPIK